MVLAYYALSFSLNVLATVLIAARLYWHKVQLERVFGEHHHPNVVTVSANAASFLVTSTVRPCPRCIHIFISVTRGVRSNNGVPLHEHCNNFDRICGALRRMVARVFDSVYPTESRTDDHLGDDEPDSGEPPHEQGSHRSGNA